jgi:RNA polymerase sigma factor (TIGR02999 family)
MPSEPDTTAQGPDLKNMMLLPDQSDSGAAEKLFAALYAELHRLAEHHLRRGGTALSLGTTTLLHEAYLNIAGRDGVNFPDRGRFLAYASRAMRGLVIDYARARRAVKRGAQFEITLTGDHLPAGAMNEAGELEHLSDALDRLAKLSPSLSELVDLHFFCGFTYLEIAEFRGVSDRTIKRDWQKARLLLYTELRKDGVSLPD